MAARENSRWANVFNHWECAAAGEEADMARYALGNGNDARDTHAEAITVTVVAPKGEVEMGRNGKGNRFLLIIHTCAL